MRTDFSLLDFRDPDNMLAGVLVIVLTALTFWFVLVKLPVLAGGVA